MRSYIKKHNYWGEGQDSKIAWIERCRNAKQSKKLKKLGWLLFTLQDLNAMFCGGFEQSRTNRSMAFSGPDVLGEQHLFVLEKLS